MVHTTVNNKKKGKNGCEKCPYHSVNNHADFAALSEFQVGLHEIGLNFELIFRIKFVQCFDEIIQVDSLKKVCVEIC